MRLAFVPLTGPMQRLAGSGFNAAHEDLERPIWRGAELSELDAFPDVLGAVSEAEYHDWIIGVRHPLFLQNGPGPLRFFDPDPEIRQEALRLAASAAQQAHHLGARFIIFPFPAPGNGDDSAEEGPKVAAFLAELQEREAIQIALMPDGPYHLDEELFERFPQLSLCLDTERLATFPGHDPLELARRWAPWTRYLRLHRIGQSPESEIAELLTEAQPNLTVILDWHEADETQQEAANNYINSLLGR